MLLLDQRLPDGLGTDSIEAMLAECPRMRVLMVTADDTDDVLARAIMAGAAGMMRTAGADQYVVKTGRLLPLLEAFERAFDLRHPEPVQNGSPS